MKQEKSILDMSMPEIRRHYLPQDEPYRSAWDALHKAHVRLLKQDNRVALPAAVKLADMKFEIYCDWQRWKMRRN